MDLNNKDKTVTPSKNTNNIVNKVLNHHFNNCDSPFRSWPNFSTPPSRVTRILNPFENHLLERLPFPAFSPSVFAQVSTPKTGDNNELKWSIDDISNIRPADIDEQATLEQQHFSDHHDAAVESLVQERINYFFNSKVVVPSPASANIKTVSMVPPSPEEVAESSGNSSKPLMINSSCQTVLTLPPILPKHIQKVLAPYFNYRQEWEETEACEGVYKNLFTKNPDDEEDFNNSAHTSPAQSTGMSPLQLSPLRPLKPFLPEMDSNDTANLHELTDCNLSPISTCRSSVSQMMVDSSLVSRVPYLKTDSSPNCSQTSVELQQLSENSLGSNSNNWDLEYDNVDENMSFKRYSTETGSDTPRSKLFTSQRKRLSDSFKAVDVDMMQGEVRKVKSCLFVDTMDFGYQTGSGTMYDKTRSVSRMSTSTPTRDY